MQFLSICILFTDIKIKPVFVSTASIIFIIWTTKVFKLVDCQTVSLFSVIDWLLYAVSHHEVSASCLYRDEK